MSGNVEQHETIEHVITESRRPFSAIGTPNRRETGYRETVETITFGGGGSGGSGGSRSPSSLRHATGTSAISISTIFYTIKLPGVTPPRIPSFQQITGYSPPQIGKYGGIDVVEVHTPGKSRFK
jgi:hypothetical protein